MDEILIWLLVNLWKWFRKLIGGAENTPLITSDRSKNISVGNKFATPIQTKSANTTDPFLQLRSRATRVGALAGMAGAVVGLFAGFSLAYIVDPRPSAMDASDTAFIAMTLACGYSLFGAGAGALVGRWSIKRDDDPEDNFSIFPRGLVGGGVAGLIIGILPHVIFWLFFF